MRASDLIGLSLGQIFGASGESDSTYKAKHCVRWRKAVSWMTCDNTVPHLVLFCMLIKPALGLMEIIFQGGNAVSVIEFAHEWSNLAVKTIERCPVDNLT